MEEVRAYWHKIAYLGVHVSMPYSLQKKTVLCNKLSLMAAVLIAASIPVLTTLNIKGYQTHVMLSVIAIAMLSVPFFNFLRQTIFTRLSISFFPPIIVLVFTIASKIRVPENIEFLDYFVPRAVIYLTILLPLVLLDFKDGVQMVLGTSSNILSLLLFDYWHSIFGVGYHQVYGVTVVGYNQINLVYMLAVAAIITAFYFYQSTNEHFEKENEELLDTVKKSNLELINKKEQLEEAYNELKQIDEEIRQNSEELKAINENLITTRDELKVSFDREKKSKEELAQANKGLKQAQMQIVQSEKMASLGQLTAGVAHEINNPINFVYAGANTLKSLLDEFMSIVRHYESLSPKQQGEQLKETITKIEALKKDQDYNELKNDIDDIVNDIIVGANRTAAIVVGLRNFSRLDEDNLKLANINECLDSTLVILSGQFKEFIKVTKIYDKSIPDIYCYPGQLNQVFLNLLNNARQAIKGSGEILITTTDTEQHVRVNIKDTGVGIPADSLNKIFEPFYTTKEIGEGTGLGLSISYGIIEKHKGHIDVKSEVDIGTEFIIEISKDLDDRLSG